MRIGMGMVFPLGSARGMKVNPISGIGSIEIGENVLVRPQPAECWVKKPNVVYIGAHPIKPAIIGMVNPALDCVGIVPHPIHPFGKGHIVIAKPIKALPTQPVIGGGSPFKWI